MIVTLTANPSHDRTVTLAEPLERGAVQRAASVTSQAGGKGVNISRASVAAGVPSIAVLPARKDDPFVHELLAAGIDCRPVPTTGRPPGQHHDQRARRHHHQAQQPRPGRDAERARRADRVAAPPRRRAPTGWCSPARCRPARRSRRYADLVAALRGTGARVAVDTSDAPLRALVDRLPDVRART